MPTTTNGLPYPSLADEPNVPQDIQNLAESLDALAGDTGWTTLSTVAGWNGDLSWRVKGGICYLRTVGTTGAISRSSNGSTTVDVATLPEGARPVANISAAAVTNQGGGGPAKLFISAGGAISAATSGDFNTTRQLRFFVTFPVD